MDEVNNVFLLAGTINSLAAILQCKKQSHHKKKDSSLQRYSAIYV